MAHLSGRQVAAGALGVATILGLCSCSRATPPGPGPSASPTIEQTVSPSPSAAPFVLRTATQADWPALADASTYKFSDKPQSEAEQFIADTYPDLWAQGVRALSPKYIDAYNYGDPKVPGATVQYVNGVRYEGTNQMPLGFRGQLTDPSKMPTDAIASMVAALRAPMTRTGNIGQGGYEISIIENRFMERGHNGIDQSNDTQLLVTTGDGKQEGETMRFADWQSAWAYLQTNGFKVTGMERSLYPGEVAQVSVGREVIDANGNSHLAAYVWDPAGSSWIQATDGTH